MKSKKSERVEDGGLGSVQATESTCRRPYTEILINFAEHIQVSKIWIVLAKRSSEAVCGSLLESL